MTFEIILRTHTVSLKEDSVILPNSLICPYSDLKRLDMDTEYFWDPPVGGVQCSTKYQYLAEGQFDIVTMVTTANVSSDFAVISADEYLFALKLGHKAPFCEFKSARVTAQ